MKAKKSVSMKAVVVLMALVLLIGCGVGGTIAYLMQKTEAVVNTFSAANIDITLTETPNTDSDNDGKNDIWTAKLVPGTNQEKDPKVAVIGGSEACWLFVKVEESGGTFTDGNKQYKFDEFVEYGINTTDWESLQDNPGVYYKKVNAQSTDQDFYVLSCKNNNHKDCKGCVNTPNTVTKDTMDKLEKAIKDNLTTAPKLTFTAYAVQSEGFDNVADAWSQAQTLS